jgi:putative peptide zinc metalloprotease protein
MTVPENQAVAYNDECVDCLTYASATQVILGYDGPVRFTAEGRRRLHALRQSLLELESKIAEMSPAELHTAVSAAKAELLAILDEELVVADAGRDDPEASTKTSTSVPSTTSTTTGSTTTAPTTSTSSTTTSSTSTTSSTTTTSTAPTTTTTTAPPATSTTTESTSTTEG